MTKKPLAKDAFTCPYDMPQVLKEVMDKIWKQHIELQYGLSQGDLYGEGAFAPVPEVEKKEHFSRPNAPWAF